ncbi:GD14231 [Drosophila simulans]|uniref:GD14231 n=1 Tax=Drosophila simulans TaxID=7240 RepID=B4QNS3_DROSI|nr:GD14231 [Drosophila simulans]
MPIAHPLPLCVAWLLLLVWIVMSRMAIVSEAESGSGNIIIIPNIPIPIPIRIHIHIHFYGHGHGTCPSRHTSRHLRVYPGDMTNGGVQGPIEGYNSLDDLLTTTPTPGQAAMLLPTAPTAAYTHPKWMEPYFDPSTPRNVTALMGKSAYLSCRVRNLANKTVSWIRHRDIHILTVGSYTYTSDQRFQATHHQDTEDWTLQIKWAQKRDAGMYECQISTQPVRSYFVRLNVVVPTATILGGPDLHVDKGSTINLTCTVKFSPEPPAYIFWYHHEEVINYDSSRGGVSVITEKGDVTTSFLLIQNADLADSGKYSCAPSNADVASVRVHVLNGRYPAGRFMKSNGLGPGAAAKSRGPPVDSDHRLVTSDPATPHQLTALTHC